MTNQSGEVENQTSCAWEEEECGVWESGCGHEFEFFSGGPVESEFVACPYCGKKLIAKGYVYDEKEEDGTWQVKR